MGKEETTKYGVKTELLIFSDGFEIFFYSIKELYWTNDEEYDEIDQISDGVFYKREILNYDNFTQKRENENDAEHIDSSEEGILIFDNLTDAKIKFEKLLNGS